MVKQRKNQKSAMSNLQSQTYEISQALEIGKAHLQVGRLLEAKVVFRQILEADSNNPIALSMMGLVAYRDGEREIALEFINEAIAINPSIAEAHDNLGIVLLDIGNLNNAIISFQNAIAIKPNFANAHFNLGTAFQRLGQQESAITCFRKSLGLTPENAKANIHAQLGYALNALGKKQEALKHLNKNLELNRIKNFIDPNDISIRFISKPKINHDIEQFRYLESLEDKFEHFGTLAQIYEDLRDEIDWSKGDGFLIPLTDNQRQKINDTYGRPFHIKEAPELPGSTLNRNLDIAGITEAYFKNTPGLTNIDNLLSAKALTAIRQFLLESTIWFHVKKNGYVGTYMQDGMACPLLLQIAEDIRQVFSPIIKGRSLKQFWAYKYGSSEKGINIHADDAYINLNFWVSLDSANLEPKHGGLVVYMVEAPGDWAHNLNYTGDKTEHIIEYLNQNEGGRQIIPHRENRGVIFNSDLFHETDLIDFKPGYENHRISVTMLYGDRED
jgi:tetratricopeptide (TPR) repeat protein